jgi:hypothetical protein
MKYEITAKEYRGVLFDRCLVKRLRNVSGLWGLGIVLMVIALLGWVFGGRGIWFDVIIYVVLGSFFLQYSFAVFYSYRDAKHLSSGREE